MEKKIEGGYEKGERREAKVTYRNGEEIAINLNLNTVPMLFTKYGRPSC
jgi:hypothetical protein